MNKCKLAIAAAFFAMTSANEAAAQKGLGDLIGSLKELSKTDKGEKSNDKKSIDLFDGLSSIFNKDKTASAEDLVGTWTYSSPAIIFDSDDALTKIGGQAAAKKLEKKIDELVDKYGLADSPMQIVFDNDGNFVQTYKKIKLKGTYSVEDNKVVLKYAGKYEQLAGKTQIEGSSLLIVTELDNLNEMLVGVTKMSKDPKIAVLSKLLARTKGTNFGMRFEKQK